MTDWSDLEQELDLWSQTGRIATFWWRDDDLNEPTEALDRLMDLRHRLDIPLHLAVIPDRVDPRIIEELRDCHVIQHGVLHQNFAGDGEKKCEFPESRPKEDSLADLVSGKNRMEELFGETFLPILVPPWNRIYEPLLADLKELGFEAISRFNARREMEPVSGLFEINTHIDPIFWRGHRSALPDEEILKMALNHLKARRTGFVDPHEPTGLLTHHLVHDERIWQVIFKLLDFLNHHTAVRWLTLPGVMALME